MPRTLKIAENMPKRGHLPMGEACRLHVHGRLLPMDRPSNEPSFLQGVCIVVGCFLIAMLLVVAFTA